MRGVGSLRAALTISSTAARRHGAIVGVIALAERLLAPYAALAWFRHGPATGLMLAASIAACAAIRGSLQRSLAVRNEAELYRSTAASILGGNVLQPTLVADDDVRLTLFQGLNRAASLLADAVPNLVANVVAAVILSVALAFLEPARITAVASAALTTAVIALFWSRRFVEAARERAWKAWDGVALGLTDASEGRLEIVASGRDHDFVAAFGRATREWERRARHVARWIGVAGRVPMAALVVVVAGSVFLDARLHGNLWSTAGVQALLLAACSPAFLGVARCLQELVVAEDRVELIARVLSGYTLDERAGVLSASEKPRIIELRDVVATYDRKGPDILCGISFRWTRGEILGIAGHNGSGKTTCLWAILGLLPLTGGGVYVDRVQLSQLDIRGWRRSIALLPQRSYLPARATVRQCLVMLDPRAEDEAMLRALELCGLVRGLRRRGADPLAVRVGALSVGERQRVALARLLCSSAPIVLLDEPDANLDATGIGLVETVIRALARDRMVLVVAHTNAILDLADRVITLEDGRVASDVLRIPANVTARSSAT